MELPSQFHSSQNAVMTKHLLESPRNQEIIRVSYPNQSQYIHS